MCDYGCSIDVRHSIQNFTNKHCCVIQAACLWIYDQQMIVHELKSFLRLIFNVSLHENTAVVNWLCSSHSCLKYWPSQWRHLTLEPLWRLQKWSKVIRVGPKKVAIAIWDEMPQRRLWSWTLTSITVKKNTVEVVQSMVSDVPALKEQYNPLPIHLFIICGFLMSLIA